MATVSSGAEEFDQLIEETLRSLRPSSARPEAADPADAADLHGVGTGLDGLIRITAAPGGWLESIQLDPKAMRSDSRVLAEQILAAANDALRAVQANVREKAAAAAGADPEVLADRLRAVQEMAVPRMQEFLRTVENLRQRSTGR